MSKFAKLLLVPVMLSSFAIGLQANAQEHPRRAEVSGRDEALKQETNADKGHLGGHYGQLKSEEHAIKRQEKEEVRANGGYLTKGEQKQLNREENHVQRQINRDAR